MNILERVKSDTELKETLKDKHGLKEELDFRNKMYFKIFVVFII